MAGGSRLFKIQKTNPRDRQQLDAPVAGLGFRNTQSQVDTRGLDFSKTCCHRKAVDPTMTKGSPSSVHDTNSVATVSNLATNSPGVIGKQRISPRQSQVDTRGLGFSKTCCHARRSIQQGLRGPRRPYMIPTLSNLATNSPGVIGKNNGFLLVTRIDVCSSQKK